MQPFIDIFNSDEELQLLYNNFEDKFKEICRNEYEFYYCDAIAYSKDAIEKYNDKKALEPFMTGETKTLII